MEEADLLKERLQAITDKRKIRENIAKKRRQIEEEKLKLQYIKKKALREQWLMDGLSQQSEEEQEAMRLQAQDEQQQSDELQSNILRIEEEIDALETQELNISANEEAVLKRLKEVERTAEDIIKELNADFQADVTDVFPSPLPDIPSFIPLTPTKEAVIQAADKEPKKATFAMEISVELDKRTGKSQVVSTATITPDTIQDRGLKVYDDGRKSVYALRPDGGQIHNGAEMTPTEVEELLHQAAEKTVPMEVQYHQPVYSVSYTGSSRPETPRTPRQTPTPSPLQSSAPSRNGDHILREESPSKTPSPSLIQQDPMSTKGDKHPVPQRDAVPAALVSVKARSEGIPAPIQLLYTGVASPSLGSHQCEADPDALIQSSAERIASPNLVNTLPEEVESKPVTMIFMGYENAEDDEEDIQAELVIIGNSDDDDDDEDRYGQKESVGEECVSYHPEGYKSKVFQPKVGVAKVTGCRDIEDTLTDLDDLELHKPTFIHKPGKSSPYLQGQKVDESANTGDVNMEKLKLCSTGR